ncbi:bifunctional proline dehydrogenase/L-glutamate gamma-semialdehyde dehydrogenase [Millisia brevis]|uniref:bifunctional proline dehydrogenase/L-glutamate gamma-semialdehyde dehydrogenase n=1 Tax=Millisia brevis TaxID=264148 RepID=UPI0008336926|nr:bifunctional proline dehydrogenase/L-glutamate gamma-semialdehyde dehydrogenase [Millisia brevis]
MTTEQQRTTDDRPSLDEVTTLVRQWLSEAAQIPSGAAARRLADVLTDPAGLDFTVGFVDRVIRPEDPRIAAESLQDLATNVPAFVPWHLRTALRTGAAASRVAPRLVVPIARRALRQMVGHLLIDAGDKRLGTGIARIRARDVRLNINLLGEAVLGEREADRRLTEIRRLLERDDVDYVSVKVSAAIAPHSAWSFDAAVDHIEQSLLPLYRFAATSASRTFINLDMEEYRDLDLTMAVFMRLLDRPELLDLEAGIVLQAYLPDALGAMITLQEWAASRRTRGGAPIKVRLVKGANLPMEHVEATLHNWPVATWPRKQDSDTNYKRVLHYALQPEHMRNVRLGVAGHNLFDVAYAWLLAGQLGVREYIDIEMLLGMAEGQAEAVRRTVGGLLLYVPVVHPKDFDVAISYLVRRLEEGASQDNFMSAVFSLHDDPELFARERDRFAASLAAVDGEVPLPNRRQDRRRDDPTAAIREDGFDNVADTDPSLVPNREWAADIIASIDGSTLGDDLVAEYTVTEQSQLDALVDRAVAAGREWAALGGAGRAKILRTAAASLERSRASLLEVMGAECGKTIDQGDPEVSEAIDFVNYYSESACALDTVDGARQVPVGLTVVTPPWNFPIAIPTGSTVAALAAGSAVIVKPAPQAKRCGSLMVQALWDAGVPRDVLHLVHTDEGEVGRRLISNPSVDRLILTGAFDTAQLFRTFRPDLPLLAETSGKNALVVTPHADFDLAVKDLVSSAFGHAGQKCSAASLAILVGSVARSRRFLDQLVDAVGSLTVGYPADPTTQMGPIIEPAAGKLKRALTELAPGERWLVEPKQLDDTGRLWSPGVKAGVARGSEFHLTEYFGPVLGLIEAADLDEALAIQNQVDYGLTAGLHSLDRHELEHWLERVEAGNLYVNRGITGAIVRRQPFGGWKKSAVGAGTKAGGPNYLVGLSDWVTVPATRGADPVEAIAVALTGTAASELTDAQRAFLLRSARSDAAAWNEEFGVARDVSDLRVELNYLRYAPIGVTIRYEDNDVAQLIRVLVAGIRSGAPSRVSAAEELPDSVAELVRRHADYLVEDDAAWGARLTGADAPARVRLLGGDRQRFAEHSKGRADIALYAQPVTEAGRIEMLPFLREQAVSVTAHRFGSPTVLVEDLF